MARRTVEEAARDVCAGVWVLREFDANCPPPVQGGWSALSTWHCRLGWLLDKIEGDCDALATAVWGEGHGKMALPFGPCEDEREAA